MKQIRITDRGGVTPLEGDALRAMMAREATNTQSGQWIQPGYTPGNTIALSVATLYLTGVYTPVPIKIDRLACEVTLLGLLSVIRLGAFAALANGLPGALIIDAGTVSGTSIGVKELAASFTIPAGRSYLALSATVITTLRQAVPGNLSTYSTSAFANPVICYTKASVSGAFPANAGAVLLSTTNPPAIQMRVA